MASKAAAQIRQGSVGLGQRQEEEKERRWDKCKAKEKEERGRKSTEAGGQTTNCSGRPSLSKGGTHRATGPVIIVVFKKPPLVPPVEEESPPLHAGWGWGSCVATTLRSRKRVKERRKTGGMRKGRGPKRGDRHGETTKL